MAWLSALFTPKTETAAEQQNRQSYQKNLDFAVSQIGFSRKCLAQAKSHFCKLQEYGAGQGMLADAFAAVEAHADSLAYWENSASFWQELAE